MAPAKNKKKLQTILITRFSAVGDIAMTIPLLYSLASSYPQHRFIFVSRPRLGQFFINTPSNLEFKGVDPSQYEGFCGLYRLYRELKKEYTPTLFADLHDVLRTKILRFMFALGGVKCSHILKGRGEKRALTRSKNKLLKGLSSTFERYSNVFECLGLPFTCDFVSLFKDGKGDISDFSFLPSKGQDKWVGIAPFAKHRGKIYPIGEMRKVVELLSKHKGVKVFCFGNGVEEETVINEWCASFKNVYSFIGKSGFDGELRFISHLDLMLSMDSANMHIASLVNTPVVSVWGATSPLAGFLGWRQNEQNCIQLSLDCRPCSVFGNKPCRYGDYRCMNIPPVRIVEHILNLLDNA